MCQLDRQPRQVRPPWAASLLGSSARRRPRQVEPRVAAGSSTTGAAGEARARTEIRVLETKRRIGAGVAGYGCLAHAAMGFRRC
ncbi:hypothetical protein ABLO16_01195 [Mycobacterium tuberculosis]